MSRCAAICVFDLPLRPSAMIWSHIDGRYLLRGFLLAAGVVAGVVDVGLRLAMVWSPKQKKDPTKGPRDA